MRCTFIAQHFVTKISKQHRNKSRQLKSFLIFSTVNGYFSCAVPKLQSIHVHPTVSTYTGTNFECSLHFLSINQETKCVICWN